MKYAKKTKKKHSSDKPIFPNCEESFAELIDGLIFVLGKKQKDETLSLMIKKL